METLLVDARGRNGQRDLSALRGVLMVPLTVAVSSATFKRAGRPSASTSTIDRWTRTNRSLVSTTALPPPAMHRNPAGARHSRRDARARRLRA
jgi:hypothetical protein